MPKWKGFTGTSEFLTMSRYDQLVKLSENRAVSLGKNHDECQWAATTIMRGYANYLDGPPEAMTYYEVSSRGQIGEAMGPVKVSSPKLTLCSDTFWKFSVRFVFKHRDGSFFYRNVVFGIKQDGNNYVFRFGRESLEFIGPTNREDPTPTPTATTIHEKLLECQRNGLDAPFTFEAEDSPLGFARYIP